jgi:hypothetical protein
VTTQPTPSSTVSAETSAPPPTLHWLEDEQARGSGASTASSAPPSMNCRAGQGRARAGVGARQRQGAPKSKAWPRARWAEHGWHWLGGAHSPVLAGWPICAAEQDLAKRQPI